MHQVAARLAAYLGHTVVEQQSALEQYPELREPVEPDALSEANECRGRHIRALRDLCHGLEGGLIGMGDEEGSGLRHPSGHAYPAALDEQMELAEAFRRGLSRRCCVPGTAELLVWRGGGHATISCAEWGAHVEPRTISRPGILIEAGSMRPTIIVLQHPSGAPYKIPYSTLT